MRMSIFLFGESEKGEFGRPLECRSLSQLFDVAGHPRDDSLGISYAVQSLLYGRDLLFCRVEEEGFSVRDYANGFKFLKANHLNFTLPAICLPGVGDKELIEAALEICNLNKSLLVLTEKDLYDYLTFSREII